MDDFSATNDLIDDDSSVEDQLLAMQQLVNSGMAWRLEGSIGRACADSIHNGEIMLGRRRNTDAYGSVISSRDDVVSGTKGSREYVVEHSGEDWAQQLEGVK